MAGPVTSTGHADEGSSDTPLVAPGEASSPSTGTWTPAPESQTEETRMDARAYQREMLEQSLKHNAIVVMPTGSGKTQVYVSAE